MRILRGLGVSSFYGGMMGYPDWWFWLGVWDMGVFRAAMGRGISGIGYGFRVGWCTGGLGTGLSFYGVQTVSDISQFPKILSLMLFGNS